MTKTRSIGRTYDYSALSPLSSLSAAIQHAAPDLIIPCDDNAAIQLQQLYAQTADVGPVTHALRVLIVRSLGTPVASALASARGLLMSIAAEQGVRIPETTVVSTPRDLEVWLTRHRMPAVIKVDCTWGGQGVAIVRNYDDARRAFKRMQSRPAMFNAMARMLLDRDSSFLLNALKDTRHIITMQDFIVGIPANRAVACWEGRVLAGISVEALRTQHSTGPATVVHVIDNPEMTEAAIRLVRRLGISGLWGIDFVVEAVTGDAYLIEVNPRATPICHLPLGAGRNLPVALYTQLTGTPPSVLSEVIEHDIIAMFPGELRRNPASTFLRSAFHDVPWNEPGLIHDCLDRPWSERGWIARLRACTRSWWRSAPIRAPVLFRSSRTKPDRLLGK